MIIIIWILVGVVLISVLGWVLEVLGEAYFNNVPKRICQITIVIMIVIVLINKLTNFSVFVYEIMVKVCATVAIVSYGIGILMDIYSPKTY